MKTRLSNPAFVSESNRVLTRVREWNPATNLICSRSANGISETSFSNTRSRGCRKMCLWLFPVIERLPRVGGNRHLSRSNLPLDIGPTLRPANPAAVMEVSGIDSRSEHLRDHCLNPALMPTLDHYVALRKVSQEFGQRFSTIQCGRHFFGIGAGKLEADVRANCHKRGADLSGMLIKELVCGNDRNAEFTSFR